MASNVPKREWHASGSACCTPCSTFCLMFWCPCILYSKTAHRIENGNDLSTFSSCNSNCWGFCALSCCGVSFFLPMFQRGEMRAKYNLQGGVPKDILCALCCLCFDLVQQDKEADYREQEKRGLLDIGKTGYVPPTNMVAQPPGQKWDGPDSYNNQDPQAPQHHHHQNTGDNGGAPVPYPS